MEKRGIKLQLNCKTTYSKDTSYVNLGWGFKK